MTTTRDSTASRRGTKILDAVRAGDIEVARVALSAGAKLPRLALPEIEALLVTHGSVTLVQPLVRDQRLGRGKGIVRYLDTAVRISATKAAEILTVRVELSTTDRRHAERVCRMLPSDALQALTSLHRALVTRSASARLLHGLASIAVARSEAVLVDSAVRTREPSWMPATIERLNDASRRVALAELAESAGLTRKQLAREFRRVHGCTVGEYQRRARISTACQLMTESAEPLAAIATATGFADHAHFTKAFKRVLGMSPREYRQAAGRANGAPSSSTSFHPVGRYAFRSKTAHGEPYDGVMVIVPAGATYGGVLQTTVMPDIPIDTVAVFGQRMLITARVPAGVAMLDLHVRGSELEGEWRLAARATPLRGRRSR